MKPLEHVGGGKCEREHGVAVAHMRRGDLGGCRNVVDGLERRLCPEFFPDRDDAVAKLLIDDRRNLGKEGDHIERLLHRGVSAS